MGFRHLRRNVGPVLTPIARGSVTECPCLPADPATVGQVAFSDYTQFLDADALDGARIGVWREGAYEYDQIPVDEGRISSVIGP